ncbi:MAG TPA: antibiotic biosynthesis monooxygenase family protein [Gemmatimonadaceae bacterium]|nr:antibiotic biosynthesis monooxygenase family protein [Gemmatimonadaceae bacterium]
MYVVIWKFRVRRGAESAFAELYGHAGGWAALFRTSPGFLGTELLRDLEGARRYLTIDRWQSRDAYDSFRRDKRAEYDELDREGASLTDVESLVGDFTMKMAEASTRADG